MLRKKYYNHKQARLESVIGGARNEVADIGNDIIGGVLNIVKASSV